MAPVVVKFTDKYTTKPVTSTKEDKKVLRSGKPISLEELKRKQQLAQQHQLKESKTKEDADDIKNDFALERLISESHILANSSKNSTFSGADLTLQTLDHENPIGKARVRTLDSRMRSLSAINGKNSGGPEKLEKMPMAMRKGMVASRMRKIEKYEREAKDAGIVLAKTKKGDFRTINDNGVTSVTDRIGSGVKKDKKFRDRGLRINSIGKSTRNGLVISPAEIAKLTSPKPSFKKKGGRRH